MNTYNYRPKYGDAVISLTNGGASGPTDGPISEWQFNKDKTPPTEEAIQAELTRQQTEYDAQEYARNRQAEYPDWSVQLNKIYDDGLAKWKTEMVDPIKAKHPKP